MRIYTVHCRIGSHSPDRDSVPIKEGFSWPAFFFGPAWALWHRLWLAFFLIVLAGFGLDFALEFAGADPLSASASALAFQAFIGFGANDWRCARLARRGWRLAGVATGADSEAALRRFFDLNPDIADTRPPISGPPAPGVALGGL